MRWLRWGILSALLMPCIVIAAWWHLPYFPAGDEPTVLRVGAGSNVAQIAHDLNDKGLLRWPALWRVIVRLRGLDGKIQQGEYELAGLAPGAVLAALVEGKVRRYAVTLPEGVTLAAALDILWKQEALIRVLESPRDPALLKLFPATDIVPDLSPRIFSPPVRAAAPATSPPVRPDTAAIPDTPASAADPANAPDIEGMFFPDTYAYIQGDTDLDVLRRAGRRMARLLARAWFCREPGLPYASMREALTMASIIEKETGQAAEREQIAGVFVRRLQRGMRLETDPTVIYGLGADYRGNLRRRHLQDGSNPYNTYRRRGLPPGPIALPGAAAIRAAMHPAAGDALFFVAKGDGSHEFSETLEQHQAAVRQYQLRRRADYRSSPAPAPQAEAKPESEPAPEQGGNLPAPENGS